MTPEEQTHPKIERLRTIVSDILAYNVYVGQLRDVINREDDMNLVNEAGRIADIVAEAITRITTGQER